MINIFKNKYFNSRVLLLVMSLCFALLLTGCPNHLNLLGYNDVPDGMGSFSLELDGSQAQGRTIMPYTGAANNRFAYYRLEFSGATTITVYRIFDTLGEAVLLNPGLHTLNVYGYTSIENRDESPHKPAAHGSININITSGQAATGNVNLLPYGVSNSNGHKGIFDLNIDFPSDVSTVKMELQSISSPGNNLVYNIHGGGSNPLARDANLELDPGEYRVIFTLERNLSNPVIWLEVLHILGNMTSSYSYTFTTDHFIKAHYAVKFYYNDDVRTSFDLTYFYDDFTSATKPDDPTRAGYTFLGWYKDAAATTGNDWVFGTPLTGPVSLYASWIPILTGTVVIYQEGDDLKLDTTLTTISGAGVSYQWLRSLVNIEGETETTYSFRTTDSGSFQLQVRREGFYGYVLSNEIIRAGARGTSADNPLIVSNLTQLRQIGTGVEAQTGIWTTDAFYLQTAPITVTGIWTPLQAFSGNYNGNGQEIRILSTAGSDNQGLFASIEASANEEKGIVQNVIIINPNITGRDNVGAIAAVNRGTIRNSAVSGGRVSGRANVGGITGVNFGTIINCYTTANIMGTDPDENNIGINVGGITGVNRAGANVQFCYSTSTVSGDNFVGGIAGLNEGSISNCVGLNPNITSHLQNAGRIAALPASGTFTNNQARPAQQAGTPPRDVTIRVTQTGTARTGNDGDTGITLGVANNMNTVFGAAWDVYWNRPSNTTINTSLALPMLKIWPQSANNAWPVLPEVRVRIGSNIAQFSIDARSFITFNQAAGSEGWYRRQLTGEWIIGEMVESVGTGSVPIPQSVTTALQAGQVHQFSNGGNVNQTIPNLGSISIRGDGTNINFALSISIPVKSARLILMVANNPNQTTGTLWQPGGSLPRQPMCTCCPSNSVDRFNCLDTGWQFPLTSGNNITGTLLRNTHFTTGGGAVLVAKIYVETEGNWAYIDKDDPQAMSPFIIFKVPDVDNHLRPAEERIFYYYWIDEDNASQSSLGPVNFYTGSNTALHFNTLRPSIAAFQALPAGVNSIPGSIWVHLAPNDPSYGNASFWHAEAGGPDNLGGLNYGSPRTEHNSSSDVSSTTVNVTLNTGEVVGTALIRLQRAHTTLAAANANPPYNVQSGSANNFPWIITATLNLNESYRQDVNIITASSSAPTTNVWANPVITLTNNNTQNQPANTVFNFTMTFTYP